MSPPAIPAILAGVTTAIGTSAAAIGSAAGFFGTLQMTGTLVASGITAGLAGLATLLTPGRPKAPGFAPLSAAARERKVSVRSSDQPQRVIYGRAKVSGPLVAIGGASSSKDGRIHFAFPVAGHRVEAFEKWFFNDKDAAGDGFADKATLRAHTGWLWQQADRELLKHVEGWTRHDRGHGIAYGAVSLKNTIAAWPNGLPNISVIVKGKRLYDPRRETIALTSIGPYWVITTAQAHGLRTGDQVFLRGAGRGEKYFTVWNQGPRRLELFSEHDGKFLETLPKGATISKLVYSDNAALCALDYAMQNYGLNCAEGEVDMDSFIAGANFCERGEGGRPRLTCDGTFDLDREPLDVLEDLLSSMGGAISSTGGRLTLHSPTPARPVKTLGADDLRGAVTVRPKPPRRDLFNGVKGTYIDPGKNWASTDFPPVTSDYYKAEDGGEEIFADIELPFTANPTVAQFLARMKLEVSRQATVVEFPANWSALDLSVWDVVALDLPHLGYDRKLFRIIGWTMAQIGGCDLILQEYAAQAYAYDPERITTVDYAPDTDLPSVFDLAAPRSLTLDSGTRALHVHQDGTVSSRIAVRWRPGAAGSPAGHEVHYRKAGDADWQALSVPAGIHRASLAAEDGAAYQVRIRAVSLFGQHSEWVEAPAHRVIGKTAPPATPATLAARQVDSQTVEVTLAPVADRDLAGFEFRLVPQGRSLGSSADWCRAQPLNIQAAPPQPRGASAPLTYRLGPVPGGEWTLGARSVDTSGNLSPGIATAGVFIRPQFDFIDQVDAMAKRDSVRGFLAIDGKLVPASTLSPRRRTVAQWNEFCPAPPRRSVFLSKIIDLGSDQRGMTVSYDIGADLGHGRAAAGERVALDVYIRREDTPTPGTWQKFNAGFTTISGRRFRLKLESDNITGRAILSHFRVLFDLVEITDAGGEVRVPRSGLAITFKRPFTRPPNVSRTALNDRDHYVALSRWTPRGATLHVRRRADNQPAGDTVRWDARGV